MANEDVKKSFHSIDHSGHIVPGGPLDERLRNIEGRLEGGGGIDNRSVLPSVIASEIAAMRESMHFAISREAQRIADAAKRIDAIEQAMKLLCTAIHGHVPSSVGGHDGTIALIFMRPDVVKVHHVRLADDSPTCLRITSIRCGLREVDGDGNINEIVYPGSRVTVTVANSGLGIVNASVLIFYEEGVAVGDSYAKGYEYGAKAGR